MREIFLSVAMLGALAANSADAQTAQQDEQRITTAANNYADQLVQSWPSLPLFDPQDLGWNAPPTAVLATAARMRAALATQRARIGAIAVPNLRGVDIDLTFVGSSLHQSAISRLNRWDAMMVELDGAIAAQAADDCAGLAAHEGRIAELRNTRDGTDLGVSFKQGTLRNFLMAFAGGPGTPLPVAVDPPQAPADVATRILATAFARELRCPSVPADFTFDVTATPAADGGVSAHVTSISQRGMRDALEQRLSAVRIARGYLLRSAAGQEAHLHWQNQKFDISGN